MARMKNHRSLRTPAFSLEDLEAGVVSANPDWLKEIWDKWPGDESIEELLAR